jgi:hypothetical protein
MERLIDIFCHAIRVTDPLSIKIAVGIVAGGLPLVFMKLGEFVGRQRETNVQRETTVANTPSLVPDEPARNKESAGRRSRSALKKQPARMRAAHS